MAIQLSGKVFTKFNEAIKLFERTATVVYPEKRERCGNCITNTIGGRSANFYRSGGPISFNRGSICPLCGGVGFITTEKIGSMSALRSTYLIILSRQLAI